MHRRDFLTASLLAPVSLYVGRESRASGTPTAANLWAHGEWFADPQWIAEQGNESAFRVVALTPLDDFLAAHIPDAVQVDWPDLALTDSADATVKKWQAAIEQRLTDLGIIPASRVAIYDGGTFYAARLWWVLDQLGHKDKRVLNGGFAAWRADDRAVEDGPAEVQLAFAPYTGTPNEGNLARLDDVIEAVATRSAVLVDARTAKEFAEGHIPGEVNIPFLDNAEPESGGRWKSPADLRSMYADKGVTADQHVIPYCSTGVRSAVTWFTLSALGFEHVRLYSASFAEWSSDPDRPVEQ